jgi:hypothetical protein
MLVSKVKLGDVITEGTGKGIEVKRLEPGCTRSKIHINRSFCYDWNAEVTVKSKPKEEKTEAVDFSDMPDHDIPISEEVKRYTTV